MKLRLKGAQKGHSLLKKKADALTLRFRQILAKIIEVNAPQQWLWLTLAPMCMCIPAGSKLEQLGGGALDKF